MKNRLRKPAILQSEEVRSKARVFEKWLNSDEKAQDLFRPLADLAAAVTKHEMQRGRYVDTLELSDPYISYEKKINRILKKIENRYPSQLALRDWGDENLLVFFGREPVAAGDEAMMVGIMLDAFETLANAGAFAVFKVCQLPDCGKRFFALRRDKRYCSDMCNRAHYGRSPERKKANAKYQREHYRNHLSVAAKQRELQRARARMARQTS